MAAQYLGAFVLVTLNAPPGLQVRGTVSHVVQGESLTLRDGKFGLHATRVRNETDYRV